MSDLKLRERVLSLLDCYENLLSPAQKEILSDYYRYDLSMSEIAEARKTSKAAVKDALDKGLGKLEETETALSHLKERERILAALDEIDSLPEAEKLAAYERLGKEYRNGI